MFCINFFKRRIVVTNGLSVFSKQKYFHFVFDFFNQKSNFFFVLKLPINWILHSSRFFKPLLYNKYNFHLSFQVFPYSQDKLLICAGCSSGNITFYHKNQTGVSFFFFLLISFFFSKHTKTFSFMNSNY